MASNKTNVKGKGPQKVDGTKPMHQRVHGVGSVLFQGSGLKQSKPAKTFKKLDKEATGTRAAANGQARVQWNGHTISSILRWMGSEHATDAVCSAWCAALGFPGIHLTTIQCQSGSGRTGASNPDEYVYGIGGHRGAVAELSKEEKAYLKSIRPQDDAE